MIPEEVAAHAVRPISARSIWIDAAEVKLGFHGERVDFDWRPYEQRSEEARADFDRLVVSIYHEGVRRPVITHRGHVLVGQRRVEIARRLGIRRMRAVEIGEDVSRWWKPDVKRLERLKAEIGEWGY